jgi:hypothetical protein
VKVLHEVLLINNTNNNNELTATLDDAEKDELLSMINSITEDTKEELDCTTSNIIGFANTASVPNGITVLPKAREFIFNSTLTCIRGTATVVTITPPNCPPIKASLYPIKVIGCIEYIAIANVNFQNDICYIKADDNITNTTSIAPASPPAPTASPASLSSVPNASSGISVSGSLSVNSIVGYSAENPECSGTIPSNAISVALDAFTVDSSGRLSISGNFVLPVITNCNDIPLASPTLISGSKF